MEFLTVDNLYKKKGNRSAVNGISFTLNEGVRLGIAGETGSGKSTLLKLIAGLEQCDSGKVYFNGELVLGPLDKLIPGHPGIAYLSQHFELRNHYRVEEILEYATLLSEERARLIFDVCRITPLLKRKTDQLSGGERQRIALARLLVGSPRLLILDEPFSNLDRTHKTIIREVLEDLESELQITCIMVSHDPADLLSWAHRILVMQDGMIIQDDGPEQIYRQPVTEYAAALMGDYLLLSPSLARAISGVGSLPANNFLVRPERIQFKENGPATGRIVSSIYFGAYRELHVEVDGEAVRVRTNRSDLVEGMSVRLWIDPLDLVEI